MNRFLYFDVFSVISAMGLWAQEVPPAAPRALNEAIRSGDKETVLAILAEGANLGTPRGESYPPLHVAADLGQLGTVNALLMAGAPVDGRSRYSRSTYDTALHQAVQRGHLPVVDALLNAGADVDAQDRFGNTALHLAVFQRDAHLVLRLIDWRANVNLQDLVGVTPRDLALRSSRHDLMMLLDAGANVNFEDESQGTVLHAAIGNRDADLVKLIIEAGGDLNVQNARGETPWEYAMRMGFCDMVAILAAADANGENRQRSSPLHVAIREYFAWGDPGLVLHLVDTGADLNAQDITGETPLHLLLRADTIEWPLVEDFINAGANLDQPNAQGETPQDIMNARNADTDSDADEIEEAMQGIAQEETTEVIDVPQLPVEGEVLYLCPDPNDVPQGVLGRRCRDSNHQDGPPRKRVRIAVEVAM